MNYFALLFLDVWIGLWLQVVAEPLFLFGGWLLWLLVGVDSDEERTPACEASEKGEERHLPFLFCGAFSLLFLLSQACCAFSSPKSKIQRLDISGMVFVILYSSFKSCHGC